ncbi:hypothetical protein REPUB_Repub20aG0106100 [Reevesia pubescens]
MDEIRETALAYYANLPESKKQKASEFFKSLDKDGDGKIDLQEYMDALNQRGIRKMSSDSFFKELDKDGSGSLDFDEVITLFYLIESERRLYCDGSGCGVFLKGVYFTCVQCFNSAKSNSFDICCSCYHNHNFKHHDDAIFCDNYVLLLNKKWQNPKSQNSFKEFEERLSASATALEGIFTIFSILGGNS